MYSTGIHFLHNVALQYLVDIVLYSGPNDVFIQNGVIFDTIIHIKATFVKMTIFLILFCVFSQKVQKYQNIYCVL